ncbi:hypothetical protein E4U49_006749 [Claviceps purpurea]|nr:hypothetical protein E4U49_006749 [Claviceps purpurea]
MAPTTRITSKSAEGSEFVPTLALQQVELMELQVRVTRAEAARLQAEAGRMAAEADYGPLRKSFNRVGSHAATLRRAYSTSQTEGCVCKEITQNAA